MPWTTLDLDPDQATTGDVKRAYARLLKQCRPDRDPEGFRKLHEAYQIALAELEYRAHPIPFPVRAAPPPASGGTPESPPAEAPPTEPAGARAHVPVSPAGAAVLEVLDQLEQALRNGADQVEEKVRAAEAALFANPGEAARWGETVSHLISTYGTHPALKFKPSALVFELEQQSASATCAVIERLERSGNPAAIVGLCRNLLASKDRIRTPAGGFACAMLACVAAPWDKLLVEQLADFAYQNLARGERDHFIGVIERHQAVAAMVKEIPAQFRRFWSNLLLGRAAGHDWQSELSQQAVSWLKSGRGMAHPAFDILCGLLPPDLAREVELAKPLDNPLRPESAATTSTSGGEQTLSWEFEAKPAPRQRPVQRVYRPAPQQPPHTNALRIVAMIVLPILLGLLRFVASSSSESRPVPRDYPPPYIADELRKRSLNEFIPPPPPSSEDEKYWHGIPQPDADGNRPQPPTTPSFRTDPNDHSPLIPSIQPP